MVQLAGIPYKLIFSRSTWRIFIVIDFSLGGEVVSNFAQYICIVLSRLLLRLFNIALNAKPYTVLYFCVL